MINSERIVRELDAHLDHEVRLVLYGRAAIALGFNDAQDMADVEFLIRHDKVTVAQLEAAFAGVMIPDLIEHHDAFKRAKPVVLKYAQMISK